MGRPFLEIHRLSKTFVLNGRKLPVLQGISLEVQEGEFVALIGPSGCGKSTLFNVLMGLVPADEGEIRLKGRAVPHLQRRAAYMIQKDLLLPWRTVLQNTLLYPEILGHDLPRAEARARELLQEVGLAGFEHAWPYTLSGGMRQRVALARTLMSGLPVLLLDEPFGALDALTRRRMQQLLLKLWQHYRPTILFVTHDVEEALLLADRVGVLTARPARIREMVQVRVPRPRSIAQEPLLHLRQKLLQLLESEVQEVSP